MSYTKQFTAVQNAWTLAITAQGVGIIQLRDPGPVLIHVGTSLPAADSNDGLIIDQKGIQGFTFSALDPTDSVWVRSLHDESNVVVAYSSGTAPA